MAPVAFIVLEFMRAGARVVRRKAQPGSALRSRNHAAGGHPPALLYSTLRDLNEEA